MAKIITEQTTGQILKKGEHKCFKRNSFLRGFYSMGNFCPTCGESLREDGVSTSYKCSFCGAALFLLEEMKYCPECGEKFEK